MSAKLITADNVEPIRLDRFLKRLFPGLTQGVIEKALRKKKIRINRRRAESSSRIVMNDEIIINTEFFIAYCPPDENKEFSQSAISLAEKLLSNYLIQSTNDYIAINKPYGLAVQGGSKINLSIDDALDYLNYSNKTEYKLVHRLDKETSGILIVANGYENAAKIGKAFRDRSIKKTYVAVLSGTLRLKQGVISNYIAKKNDGTYELVREDGNGKKADTAYKILSSRNNLSLVEFQPATGRTHQLRVHSLILGYPIVGDKKYGSAPYSRMLLHAKELILPKTVFGSEIKIITDLPRCFDLNDVKIY